MPVRSRTRTSASRPSPRRSSCSATISAGTPRCPRSSAAAAARSSGCSSYRRSCSRRPSIPPSSPTTCRRSSLLRRGAPGRRARPGRCPPAALSCGAGLRHDRVEPGQPPRARLDRCGCRGRRPVAAEHGGNDRRPRHRRGAAGGRARRAVVSRLEAVLLTHDRIADAAVIGVRYADGNEVPKGFVVPRPGAYREGRGRCRRPAGERDAPPPQARPALCPTEELPACSDTCRCCDRTRRCP